MADQQFDILIKFGLSKEKATEAAAELRKLEAATTKQTVAAKEAEKVNIKVSESVRDQMNPALAHATEVMEEGTAATGRWARAKNNLAAAARGLGPGFQQMAGMARAALHPVSLAVAGLVLSFTNLKKRNDEAVESLGGFKQVGLTEDFAARFERVSNSAQKMAASAPGIEAVFAAFEKNENIATAFLKGAGLGGPDTDKLAQAAREAAERSEFEAARQRGIAGNIDPNNPLAGDMAKLLPALEEQRTKIQERLGLATKTQEAGFWDPVNWQFLLRFGAQSPRSIMEREQSALSAVDAQIAGIMGFGRRRGERIGAFNAAGAAESQAASMFERAASFGAAGAGESGRNFATAAGEMGKAGGANDLFALIRAAGELANEVRRARERTEAALKDQANANRIRGEQQ